MKSRRDWPSRRLDALEKEWGTGRSSTSGIVPYTRWRCPAVSPCWQLALTSPRRTCPDIGCSCARHNVNRRRGDRRGMPSFPDGDIWPAAAAASRKKFKCLLVRVPVRRFGAYCLGGKPHGERCKHDKCPGERHYRLKAGQRSCERRSWDNIAVANGRRGNQGACCLGRFCRDQSGDSGGGWRV